MHESEFYRVVSRTVLDVRVAWNYTHSNYEESAESFPSRTVSLRKHNLRELIRILTLTFSKLPIKENDTTLNKA